MMTDQPTQDPVEAAEEYLVDWARSGKLVSFHVKLIRVLVAELKLARQQRDASRNWLRIVQEVRGSK
jgi:hypothetical protein